jgi:drug/metabolite transporter (DMT)-like permease
MTHLILVSIAWAFSFGLIGKYLAGLNSSFVAWARLAISLVVFLPFLRRSRLPRGLAARLALVGGLQYGLMYLLYIESYQYLAPHQVAIFTIFTPLFVTLIHDAERRRFNPVFLGASAAAVLGAGVINYRSGVWEEFLAGFCILQVANLCFAYGQVRYRSLMADAPAELRNRDVFAWLYAGAAGVATAAALWRVEWGGIALTGTQAGVLLYLGLVPSGLCFFLWNVGARRVNAGTLAVMNNLKIPLAVAVSLLVFREDADLLRLAAGGTAIFAALAASEVHAWRRRTATVAGKAPAPPR